MRCVDHRSSRVVALPRFAAAQPLPDCVSHARHGSCPPGGDPGGVMREPGGEARRCPRTVSALHSGVVDRWLGGEAEATFGPKFGPRGSLGSASRHRGAVNPSVYAEKRRPAEAGRLRGTGRRDMYVSMWGVSALLGARRAVNAAMAAPMPTKELSALAPQTHTPARLRTYVRTVCERGHTWRISLEARMGRRGGG